MHFFGICAACKIEVKREEKRQVSGWFSSSIGIFRIMGPRGEELLLDRVRVGTPKTYYCINNGQVIRLSESRGGDNWE